MESRLPRPINFDIDFAIFFQKEVRLFGSLEEAARCLLFEHFL